MNRGIIFPGQVPLETDLLYAQQQSMVGLSKLAAAVLGTSTLTNGLAVTQTGVASMNVQVAPGEIYAVANLEATAYSSLPLDATHTILKQGISLDNQLLALTAPGTAGFSVNYLIQATFAEVDSTPVTLPYYNASNPSTAYSGPANAGTAQNTRRIGSVVLSAKAGTAATTGSQTTPAPDAGYVGIAVVTVANGAATVVNGNISAYASAPVIPAAGLLVGGFQNNAFITAMATGTTDALTAAFTPVVSSMVNGMMLYVRAGAANATTIPTFSPNGLTAKQIVKGNNLPLAAGDIAGAGHWIELQYDLTLDKWVLLNPATGVQAFATNAEAQGFSVTSKPISPATLAQAFKGANQSLASSGYQKLPGGLILQWGTVSFVASATATATLPIAFPTSMMQALAISPTSSTPITTTGASTTSVSFAINGASTTTAAYLALGF